MNSRLVVFCFILFVILISSTCKKQTKLLDQDWDGKVIIVGAGISGLYAGYMLGELGIDYTILEASNRVGGRIRTLDGFSDFPIELGAEEVHGEKTVWYRFLKDNGVEFVEGETTDFLMLDSKLQSYDDVEEDADVKKALEFQEDMEDYEGSDITVSEYIKQQNIPSRVEHLLNAVIGNEYGTSNDSIGVNSIVTAENEWTAGEKNFLPNGYSYMDLINDHFKDVIKNVQLNKSVTAIDYSQDRVKITDISDSIHVADKVILTVPLSVLKKGMISFNPKLPTANQDAIDNIKMGQGMKIILKFSERFWDENTGSIYGEGYVPEFWSTGTGRSVDNNVLTAFVMGANAKYLSDLDSGAVDIVLQELDDMYGAGIASGKLVSSYIMDWTKEPYILGSYSYPNPDSDKYRNALAASVEDKIFFAGEATNFNGHIAMVHGAIETSIRVIDELVTIINNEE
ncbi:MAG: FAD-dependent oxidoreductase [Bacteroidia bacterium]|nr:FAD-dependent oxidoreductase [Bacteroidia bacterium]